MSLWLKGSPCPAALEMWISRWEYNWREISSPRYVEHPQFILIDPARQD